MGLLDFFDANDMWSDTCMVLTTDHGFLLGEHDWWAKNRMPVYDEIARIPLIIHHPDFASLAGTRRSALTQATDIMPTRLQMSGLDVPTDVTGRSLIPVLSDDTPVRSAAMYGYFGAAVNITDGRYTYFHYPKEMTADGLYEYTLMPTRMTTRFSIRELVDATLHPPFDFTKGVPVLKLLPRASESGHTVEPQGMSFEDTVSRLYDLKTDPSQQTPIDDPVTQARLKAALIDLMRSVDAPSEAFARFELDDTPDHSK